MRPRTIAAVVLYVVAFWVFVLTLSAHPDPEGSLGVFPLPEIVGMADHDVLLMTGKVDAADHEAAEGFFSVGKLTISVPRDSVMQMHLNDKRGQVVELRLRVVEPRGLQEVKR